ncbi:MAG: hypothetical protein JSW39_16675 [Desulfobacterales bacterium]|nr:MAG: hypothetical protein JSW39_16675 [Desulfobacterales bacterium]
MMNLCRREFLKTGLAAGSLLTGAGALMTSCSGITRAKLTSVNASDEPIADLDKRHIAILNYASLAPSGHNSQPWIVKIVEKNKWIIGADPDRRLPAVDPNNRELMLSLGAFAENLFLAAGTFGLKAEMQIIAKTSFDQEIIEVTLKESKSESYPLKRITQRMTAKHGYLANEIKKEDMTALSGHLKGRLFYFPRGTEHAQCIEEGAVENFRIQANRGDALQELAKWLRLGNEDAKRHRDGLTTEGMEIRGFSGWFVRNFFKPEDFMKPRFRRQGIYLTEKLAQQGGGWFIVNSEGNTVADWIDTGRRFERLALMARERNIAIHPMTQHLEEKAGQKQIADNHDANIMPQFVLRVGYLSKYPDPVSLRRPVSWFVKSG